MSAFGAPLAPTRPSPGARVYSGASTTECAEWSWAAKPATPPKSCLPLPSPPPNPLKTPVTTVKGRPGPGPLQTPFGPPPARMANKMRHAMLHLPRSVTLHNILQ
eukprot:6277593-Pyramimonas_sp.AAC.1